MQSCNWVQSIKVTGIFQEGERESHLSATALQIQQWKCSQDTLSDCSDSLIAPYSSLCSLRWAARHKCSAVKLFLDLEQPQIIGLAWVRLDYLAAPEWGHHQVMTQNCPTSEITEFFVITIFKFKCMVQENRKSIIIKQNVRYCTLKIISLLDFNAKLSIYYLCMEQGELVGLSASLAPWSIS